MKQNGAQKAAKARQQSELKAFRDWTSPIGTTVDVTKDGGSVHRGVTESDPWMLCGTPVIKVSGISGGYLLTRVKAAS